MNEGGIVMTGEVDVQKPKVLIWGAGQATKDFWEMSVFWSDVIDIVAVTDNNSHIWGDMFDVYPIIPPQEAYSLEFDCIIIPSGQYYKEIAEQIIAEANIDKRKIDNPLYVAKCKLFARYGSDIDKQDILSYINSHELGVFNYPYVEKYKSFQPNIGFDSDAKLYYVLHNGQRMYMARRFDTVDKVAVYYKSLCVEQDKESPHLYLEGDFDVAQNDVVIDVGAAEGIFTLSIIEKAKRVYLIEADDEWIEALGYTFKRYHEKIEIINAFIADYEGYNTHKLDNLICEEVNFIKMDIEGCEYSAMNGAKKLIRESNRIRCAVCVYHNDNDEVLLEEFGKNMGMKTEFSKGFMFYWVGIQQRYILPTLRRGVMRCTKNASIDL